MKLKLTPRAAQDLADIAEYIRGHDPTAAVRVRSAILHSLESLVLFPEAGRAQTVEGVRKLVTPKFPYLIYYTADQAEEQVVVLTVQHAAREREHTDT